MARFTIIGFSDAKFNGCASLQMFIGIDCTDPEVLNTSFEQRSAVAVSVASNWFLTGRSLLQLVTDNLLLLLFGMLKML